MSCSEALKKSLDARLVDFIKYFPEKVFYCEKITTRSAAVKIKEAPSNEVRLTLLEKNPTFLILSAGISCKIFLMPAW